ncbi:hypothetical protein ALC62_06896 [Cyphomyrmex costatus]|uniref:HAT C-terminal dimerisation domain-containing protein n=1 Tax=Cyphomyrmex costatus TaxID=456900 RepID=A0A151IIA3_9HYME|nr:hypothetical protein ALC62_06896 [Cyphomyrmex costatus]
MEDLEMIQFDVKTAFLHENSKYYSLIVDATLDSAHVEQTTFILRYLHLNSEEGVDSAECFSKAITFFGIVQKYYAIFSSNPGRWSLFISEQCYSKIGQKLHLRAGVYPTRWFARIDAVKPCANHLPKLQSSLRFFFLWKFTTLEEENAQIDVNNFVEKYAVNVSKELIDEIIHLKHIYEANFEADLSSFNLLNAITSDKLETLFSNICVALRIFCTLPVSVANGKRSFSVLFGIKNFRRSCSIQIRVKP